MDMAQLAQVSATEAQSSNPQPWVRAPRVSARVDSELHPHPRERDELITEHLSLARAIARQYAGRGVDTEDLFQVAALALVHAAARFDPARGSTFAAYAGVCVHGELKRHLRDHGWAVRPPRALHDLHHQVAHATADLTHTLGTTPTLSDIAHYLDVDLGQVRAAHTARSAYTAASWEDMTRDHPDRLLLQLSQASAPDIFDTIDVSLTIEATLSNLPRRDQQILRLRFEHDLTQQEIGKHLGISQMQVSRLLSSIIKRLRTQLTSFA